MAFHINAAGNPGACSAQEGNCPFGSAEEHYTTKEAARSAYEAQQEALTAPQRRSATLTYEAAKAMPLGTVVKDNDGYWARQNRHYVKTTEATWATFFHEPTPAEVETAVKEKRNNLSPAPMGAFSEVTKGKREEASLAGGETASPPSARKKSHAPLAEYSSLSETSLLGYIRTYIPDRSNSSSRDDARAWIAGFQSTFTSEQDGTPEDAAEEAHAAKVLARLAKLYQK